MHQFKSVKIFYKLILTILLVGSCATPYDIAPPEPDRTKRPKKVLNLEIKKKKTENSKEKTNKDNKHNNKKEIKSNIITGNCDEIDQEIYTKNASFLEKWRSCGRDTWGDGRLTVNCIRGQYGELRGICGACFGDFTECGARNCKGACWWNSASSECTACGLRECGAAWTRCSGSSVSSITE
jgi:hypothetical protein